jgi:hypothetical protein
LQFELVGLVSVLHDPRVISARIKAADAGGFLASAEERSADAPAYILPPSVAKGLIRCEVGTLGRDGGGRLVAGVGVEGLQHLTGSRVIN